MVIAASFVWVQQEPNKNWIQQLSVLKKGAALGDNRVMVVYSLATLKDYRTIYGHLTCVLI